MICSVYCLGYTLIWESETCYLVMISRWMKPLTSSLTQI